jgi:tRNA-modifying protein YgfZ
MLSNTSSDGLVKVSGPDAKKLLQGQLTCDVNALQPNESTLSALCNREGRVISLFRLFLYQDAYYLFMAKSMVPLTLSALKKYAVFYKTTLADASDELPHILQAIPLEKYADIHKGLPAIYPETSGKFLPHDINLPELNVISFDKGCYTGQEIIARMHYKAKRKKRLALATITTSQPLLPGMDVLTRKAQEKVPAGVIVDVEEITKNHYNVLLIIEESITKDYPLFIEQEENTFFTL